MSKLTHATIDHIIDKIGPVEGEEHEQLYDKLLDHDLHPAHLHALHRRCWHNDRLRKKVVNHPSLKRRVEENPRPFKFMSYRTNWNNARESILLTASEFGPSEEEKQTANKILKGRS